MGSKFPFDGTDEWLNSQLNEPASDRDKAPDARDWTHAAARGIIYAINEADLGTMDEAGRAALIKLMADIIAEAEPTEQVSDGHGSTWSTSCPVCHTKSIEIVRPGKVQCTNCGLSSSGIILDQS